MANLFFENSVDFKKYTAKICGDLNKTKLNQLRHAISKSMGYSHLELLYRDLDAKSGMHLDVGPEEEKLISPNSPARPYNGMKVVAFSSPYGGSGKTLLSSMLAISAATGFYESVKKPVLAIDYDPHGIMSQRLLPPEEHGYFGRPYNTVNNGDTSFLEAVSGSSLSPLYGETSECHKSPNFNSLYCIPSHYRSSKAFEDVFRKGLPHTDRKDLGSRLKEFFELEEVNRNFDLVVVDLPPSVTAIRDIVLSVCTDVVLSITCTAKWDIISLDKQIAEIDNINDMRYSPLNVASIVVNNYKENDPGHIFVWEHLDKGLRNHSRFGSAISESAIPHMSGLFKSDIINISDVKLFQDYASCFLRTIGQQLYGEGD